MKSKPDLSRSVAVFGSGEPVAGDPAYLIALRAGERLAQAGWTVLNGGYGGVMEAVSQGARQAGGQAVGITVAAFARNSGGNAWLSSEVREDDLYTRTRALVDPAGGYLILPGKAGTLAELSFLWALRRASLLGARPIVTCGPLWPAVIQALRDANILDPATLDRMWHADQIDDAVDLLLEHLP